MEVVGGKDVGSMIAKDNGGGAQAGGRQRRRCCQDAAFATTTTAPSRRRSTNVTKLPRCDATAKLLRHAAPKLPPQLPPPSRCRAAVTAITLLRRRHRQWQLGLPLKKSNRDDNK